MKRKKDTCRFCGYREMVKNNTDRNLESESVGWCIEHDKQAPRKAEACGDFSKTTPSSQRSGR